MSELNDGGPAFPCPWGCDQQGMHLPAEPKGMSLRDYFAAAALQAYLTTDGGARTMACIEQADRQMGLPYLTIPEKAKLVHDHLASASYQVADAMLAARENPST